MPSQKYFAATHPVRPHLVRPGGGLGGEIHDLRRDVDNAFATVEQEQVSYHESIVTASAGTSAPGQTATPVVIGATLALSFSLNNDSAHRTFKIPGTYVGDAAFHVHWTKNGNGDESGNAVRWHLEYSVWNGQDGDLTSTSTVEVEDTYSDSGTTTRLSMRTANSALSGFVPYHYASMRITAITPVGTPLVAEPALLSLDLTYTRYMNINNT